MRKKTYRPRKLREDETDIKFFRAFVNGGQMAFDVASNAHQIILSPLDAYVTVVSPVTTDNKTDTREGEPLETIFRLDDIAVYQIIR